MQRLRGREGSNPTSSGATWQLKGERAGLSPREAGALGGRRNRGRHWHARSPETRREAGVRWLLGEGTQAELAREYGVALTTMRRWCRVVMDEEEGTGDEC